MCSRLLGTINYTFSESARAPLPCGMGPGSLTGTSCPSVTPEKNLAPDFLGAPTITMLILPLQVYVHGTCMMRGVR